MSHPPTKGPLPLPIEGPSATNWRAVLAVGIIAMLVVAGLGLSLALGPAPKPPESPAPPPRLARSPSPGEDLVPLPAARNVMPVEVSEEVVAPRKRETVRRGLPNLVGEPELVPRPTVVADASPAPQAEEAARSEPEKFRRRDYQTEHSLESYLRELSTEVKLDSVPGASAKLFETFKNRPNKKELVHPALELLAKRDDLAGLPARRESECQLEEKLARQMEKHARELRQLLPRSDVVNYQHLERFEQAYVQRQPKLTKEAIAALVQVLQGRELPFRFALIEALAKSDDLDATTALARLALFDLAPEVRQEAIAALRPRPAKAYRQVLLDGLRYPWAPVADHAAEALVALKDREAVPALVELLDRPDPTAPFANVDKKLVVPELVRVNHLVNCALCHAPAPDRTEPLCALVPTPGEPLREGYDDGKSRGSFVRADVTYLKQDFSVLHHVPKPNRWPALQRFDYFIRLRPLTEAEAEGIRRARETRPQDLPPSYAQRDAVLFALRELLGKDVGSRTEDWRRALQEQTSEDDP